MSLIEDSVSIVKKANAAKRKAEAEKKVLNDLAKEQRVEIRRLKRLLAKAVDMLDKSIRDDKFFEEVDLVLHKEEL